MTDHKKPTRSKGKNKFTST